MLAAAAMMGKANVFAASTRQDVSGAVSESPPRDVAREQRTTQSGNRSGSAADVAVAWLREHGLEGRSVDHGVGDGEELEACC